jgi:hypothetical protein
VVGGETERLLYQVGWGLESVGDHLVILNGLLRPLVHRARSAMVAQLNRIALAAVRPGLLDLQDGRCFYCGGALSGSSEVDHFIPWARYPDDGIENLVLADAGCNGAKRDFLWLRGPEFCPPDPDGLHETLA